MPVSDVLPRALPPTAGSDFQAGESCNLGQFAELSAPRTIKFDGLSMPDLLHVLRNAGNDLLKVMRGWMLQWVRWPRSPGCSSRQGPWSAGARGGAA
eukprot:10970310-Alexandrium_andersonii.AAC.1